VGFGTFAPRGEVISLDFYQGYSHTCFLNMVHIEKNQFRYRVELLKDYVPWPLPEI
jgi:hypothetical protein